MREVRSSIVGVLSFGMTIRQPRSSWIYEYGSYELSKRCSQGREKRKQTRRGDLRNGRKTYRAAVF